MSYSVHYGTCSIMFLVAFWVSGLKKSLHQVWRLHSLFLSFWLCELIWFVRWGKGDREMNVQYKTSSYETVSITRAAAMSFWSAYHPAGQTWISCQTVWFYSVMCTGSRFTWSFATDLKGCRRVNMEVRIRYPWPYSTCMIFPTGPFN